MAEDKKKKKISELKITINDIVGEVHKAVTTKDISKKDSETLNIIDAAINELKDTSISGTSFEELGAIELSKILGTLALLKDTLGEMLAAAGRNVSYGESRLDFRKANMQTNKIIIDKLTTIKGKSPNLEDIRAEITKQSFIEKTILIFREEYYEKLKNKLWSLNTLIDVIKVRIGVLQSNKADIGLQDDSLDYNLIKDAGKVRTDEEIEY